MVGSWYVIFKLPIFIACMLCYVILYFIMLVCYDTTTEEIGLLGSTFYVQHLNETSPAELQNIALNLNFDMLGSPNYFLAIYNGSGAEDISIRNASAIIQSIFEQNFIQRNISWDLTGFNGRSDYGPFIAAGIPAGGLFTGAEDVKTPEQRVKYGGLANAAFDPCYHASCDTVSNINQVALKEMAIAAAYTLEYLATTDNLRTFLSGEPPTSTHLLSHTQTKESSTFESRFSME